MNNLDIELLARDVAALHAAHTAGTWQPLPAETELADALTRGQWSGPLFRVVLRELGTELAGGSLAGVLESAAAAPGHRPRTVRAGSGRVTAPRRFGGLSASRASIPSAQRAVHGGPRAAQPFQLDSSASGYCGERGVGGRGQLARQG